MSFNYKSLLLTAVLPLALTGCGGSGSNPAPQPDPKPVPQPTKIIRVTAAGQDAQNLQMTSPVISSTVNKSLLSSKSALGQLKDEDNVNPIVTLTIEYTGDNAPALPSSSDGSFSFNAIDYDEPCASPVNQGDVCMHANFYFTPKTTSYNNSVSLLNGMVKAHGYVPFRMFPLNNTMVTGTPTKPGFHMQMTTVDPVLKAQFNPQGMPSTATLSSPDLVDEGSNPQHIPFTVKADTKDKNLIDVDYACDDSSKTSMASCEESLDTVKLLMRTYDSSNTSISYTATAPSDEPAESATSIPVNTTFTRAFMVTTDKGEVYTLNNPTSPAITIAGIDGYGSFSNEDLSNGTSIQDITLPFRELNRNHLLSDSIPSSKDASDSLYREGQLTGGMTTDKSAYDINIMDISNRDNQAKSFYARSRFVINVNDDYIASLTDNAKKDGYQLVADWSNSPNDHPVAQTFDLKDAIPTLQHVKMLVSSNSSIDQANVLISGYNAASSVKAQQLYLATLTFDANKKALVLSKAPELIDPDMAGSPVIFDYNTYNLGTKLTNLPETKFAYLNADDSTLTIAGYNQQSAGDTAPNVTNVSLKGVEGSLVAFTCSDTDLNDPATISNRCYMLTEKTNSKTNTTSHREYYFNNLDVDAGHATTSSDFGILAFTDSIMKPLTKAVIDGNTGALLALGTDNKMSLYVLNDKQYQKSQAVTLPNTKAGKAQLPTNIYEY